MVHLSTQAQQVIKLAKDIARQYEQGYVGTEHLLLAIVRAGTGLATTILREHGATEEKTTMVVEEAIRDRLQDTWVMGRLPGTPHFKDVVVRASDEARGYGNWQVCPEHLLLALAKEKGSTGQRALEKLGLSSTLIKTSIRQHAGAVDSG